ncbi:penicillin-binding protein 2 [bacterium]|nr:penicillin-binding protein 2 [bacterium]
MTASSASPLLLRRRAGWLVTAVGLAWCLLAGRLIQLQSWQNHELSQRANRQSRVAEEVIPRPGDIYDAQGRLLATTIRTRSLFVVPTEVENRWTFASDIASALSLDANELYARLGQYSEKQFLWIKRRLNESEEERVRELTLPPASWGFREEYQRVYPQGAIAAQVLGLRDIDGIGRGGIEESCDATLRGQPGKRWLTRDARGRVIDVIDDPEQLASPGSDVRLTIDSVLQLYTEQALDDLVRDRQPEACCAIVMHPASGHVLAMASRPTFDPNAPDNVPEDAWKNRAISDIYEPGSTIKPIFVAYGLDRHRLAIDDAFDCEWGRYRMGKRLLHDHHPYGTLNLTDVLVKSSNIGMAKVGERLTNEGLFQSATLFGFGRVTGIELPGEQPGLLHPLDEWTSYSTGSIPMGHEIATTPLQLITAHAVLANGGQHARPRILLTDDAEASALQSLSTPLISREVADWVVQEPMRQVVTRGTGRKAQLDGYIVFGKTGTAQCLSPHGGYLHGKYISSFLCGAPAEQPEILVLVVINQASGSGGETFGGQVAAPVAARILRDALVHQHVSPTVKTAPLATRPGTSRLR